MKSFKYLFLFFALTPVANAQNIVSNPTFALHDTCPDSYSQIRRCTYWSSPDIGTPDYFNSCTSSAMGVPLNLTGYQASPSNAYAGGYTYVQGTGASEYITTTIPLLEIGRTYKVTIKISLADSATHGTDGFGVFFYKNAKPDTTWPSTIAATPQVDYTSSGAITDKINWVILSKNFVADSAYSHLVIGNFKDEASTTKILDPSVITSLTPFAYYYYDSVAVEKVSNAFLPPVTSGVTVSCYPNPFTDYTTLSLGNTLLPCQLYIYNVQGEIVRKLKDITSNEINITRDNLPQGLYFYHLYTGDNVMINGKMTIW